MALPLLSVRFPALRSGLSPFLDCLLSVLPSATCPPSR